MTGRANKDFQQAGIDRHGRCIHLAPRICQSRVRLPSVLDLPPFVAQALERRGNGLALLVVRLGALGDILRTLPPVRLLRRALPEARLYWVAEQRFAAVLEGHADLDGLIELPRRDWEPWFRNPARWPRLVRSVAAFRRSLRALEPGLALDFHGNLKSGVVSRMSGAPVRLGYSGHQQKEGNWLFSTHRVGSGERRTPRMERNLDLLRALNVPVGELPDGGLVLQNAGRPAADRLLAGLPRPARPYAVISPGASARQAYKKPPPALLAAAAHRLAAGGVTALVVHGPGEEEDARAVVARAGGDAVLAPPTDLAALAALLERARLFVGGDSGPLHLACALGCPVVGIYGPTDPRVNRPWAVPYRVVHPPDRRYTGIKKTDRASGGFDGLEPARVGTAVGELLA